jgi:hypothetical protein
LERKASTNAKQKKGGRREKTNTRARTHTHTHTHDGTVFVPSAYEGWHGPANNKRTTNQPTNQPTN